MSAPITAVMRTAIAAILALLGTMGIGCVQHPASITWKASGLRIAELDLPLGGDGNSFRVGEYVLEGREDPAGGGRQFQDRLLLTADLRRSQGPAFGYVNRTYRDGGTQAWSSPDMVELRLNSASGHLSGRGF